MCRMMILMVVCVLLVTRVNTEHRRWNGNMFSTFTGLILLNSNFL